MSGAVPPVEAAPAACAPPPASTAPAAPRCENCGAPVTHRYCPECGQKIEAPVHSLWHFMKLASEDLTHADSRLWRTLAALLFKPGYLTQEFLRGRRARYLPPLRLYLVVSVVFFLLAATLQPEFTVLRFDSPHAGKPELSSPAGKDRQAPLPGAGAAASPGQPSQEICNVDTVPYTGPWARQLGPLLAKACRNTKEDQRHSLQQVFTHNLPRAMFLFLPLLAAAMKLMYWRPRHYYVEHLLLLVHDHAFVFLALLLSWALEALLPFAAGKLGPELFLYIVWYMYRSMRVVYGQARWLTIGKLVLLSFFYLVSGAVMLALTSVYSALTL
jgi:hypothetical protein